MAFGNKKLTILIGAKDKASAKLEALRLKIESNSAAYNRAGKKMLMVSAAIGAGLGVAIKQAADFEQQMAQVSTMLDKNTMYYMPKFEKAVKDMSLEFGEGTNTLADGLYNILSASIPAEKAIGVLDVSVRAAKAGLTDTGIAADAITTILNSYNLSADKAADVSDLLFAIVKKGKLTFADLAPNIGKVAAMASKAGISLENLGATISTLTRSGVRTEMAMTAVRGIMNAMMKPAKEAADIFENKLGLAMNTTTLRAEGVIGILKRMKEEGLKTEDIAKIFPNVRALTGVVAAMGNLEGMTEDFNFMIKRAGLSTEAYNKNINTTKTMLAKMKQGFNVVAVELGVHLLPAVNKIIGSFLEIIKKFRNLSDRSKKLITTITSLTGVVTALIGVSLILLSKLPFIVAGIKLISIQLTTLTPIVGGVTIAIYALLKAFESHISIIDDYNTKVLKLQKTKMGMIEHLKNEREELLNLSGAGKSLHERDRQRIIDITKTINLLKREVEAEKLLKEEKVKDKEDNKIDEELQKRIDASKIVNEKLKAETILKGKEQATQLETQNEFIQSIEALNNNSYQNELKRINDTYKEKKKAMVKNIKDAKHWAIAMNKLETWKEKQTIKLGEETSVEKRTQAINTAEIAIQAIQTGLDAEGLANKKKKSWIIALIAMEKALAIARVWASMASFGPAAVAMATAQTALIGAQFAQVMKNMRQKTKAVDTNVPDIYEPTSMSEIGIGGGGENLVTSGEYTTVGKGVTGGVSPSAIKIDFGGVNLNFDVENLGEVKGDELEHLLRDIAEAIKSKTTEAVTMAMRAFNLGKELEGESV